MLPVKNLARKGLSTIFFLWLSMISDIFHWLDNIIKNERDLGHHYADVLPPINRYNVDDKVGYDSF